MEPGFAPDRNRAVKAVHQKAFAATDAAIHINTARHVRVIDELFQRIRAAPFVISPLVGTALKRVDRTQLGRITPEAARSEFRFMDLFDAQSSYGIVLIAANAR